MKWTLADLLQNDSGNVSFDEDITIDASLFDNNSRINSVKDIHISGHGYLDEDEKGVHSMNTPGGAQDLSVVNESGLYSLILTSRKPEAKAFKKWVTAEVLPAIRKHGMYLHAPAMRPSLTKDHWRQIDQKMNRMLTSWAFGHASKGWIYNHMRVVFQVHRFEDVPAILETPKEGMGDEGNIALLRKLRGQ